MAYVPATASPSSATDIQGLEVLRNKAQHDPAGNLKAAASQFESLMIQNLLKTARASRLYADSQDPGMNNYLDLRDQQIALALARKGGVGIADMLVKQLQHSLGQAAASGPQLGANLGRQLDQAYKQTVVAAPPSAAAAAAEPEIIGGDRADFVAAVWPAAQKAAQLLGVDPAVLVAQAAVESAWGKSLPRRGGSSSHNLFGIKADSRWKGGSFTVSTLEYESGVAFRRQDPFRAYSSFADSFADYANFLRSNPRYRHALAQAGNPEAFLHGLQSAGYATDPNYANKIIAVLHGQTLQGALASLKMDPG